MRSFRRRKSSRPRAAYFCMEFGLHNDLPIYGGGLGILAGDILKAAHDHDLPLVGIGILWRQGYVQQMIDQQGVLYDCYPRRQFDFLDDTGVRVTVRIRGRQVRLKVWKCSRYKNNDLYLLDADLPENADRFLTGQLYGWFGEERVAQEMILGIGGVRALRALGLSVDLYHFNDCHPLFAGLELIRERMDDQEISFEEAWAQTRPQVVFTTHTPVPAGNESHSLELLHYMGADLGLTYGQLLALGGSPFNMAAAGLRLSRRANAVSQLHAKTARRMWRGIAGGAELLAITNGVHNGTWQDARVLDALQNKGDLWAAHQEAKRELIAEVQLRTGQALSEDVLLIGFGRRVTGYKRHMLIFKNEKVIAPLLESGKLQIVFAGKAHPHDLLGREIVEELHELGTRYPARVVFAPNYDMRLGALLTRGCDVWLNNPIRPMEASGSSGMKAAMNGVLNLSVLDGWWPEGCRHGRNGWQIGGGYEGPDADKVDAAALYKLLKSDVIPIYYGNRSKWLRMMRASIEMASERFSAKRMLDEYYEKLYAEKQGGPARAAAVQHGPGSRTLSISRTSPAKTAAMSCASPSMTFKGSSVSGCTTWT